MIVKNLQGRRSHHRSTTAFQTKAIQSNPKKRNLFHTTYIYTFQTFHMPSIFLSLTHQKLLNSSCPHHRKLLKSDSPDLLKSSCPSLHTPLSNELPKQSDAEIYRRAAFQSSNSLSFSPIQGGPPLTWTWIIFFSGLNPRGHGVSSRRKALGSLPCTTTH